MSEKDAAEILFGDTVIAEPEKKEPETTDADKAQILFGDPPEKKQDDVFQKAADEDKAEKAETEDDKPKELTDDQKAERSDKLGDALEIDRDNPVAEPFLEFATTNNLGEDEAQEMMELHAQANIQAWDKISNEWREEAATLSEETVSDAKDAFNDLVPEDDTFRSMAELYLGNNATFIKILAAAKRGLEKQE